MKTRSPAPAPLTCAMAAHLSPERWQTYRSWDGWLAGPRGSRAKLCSSWSSGDAVGTGTTQRGRSSERHRSKVRAALHHRASQLGTSRADTHREKVKHIRKKVCGSRRGEESVSVCGSSTEAAKPLTADQTTAWPPAAEHRDAFGCVWPSPQRFSR